MRELGTNYRIDGKALWFQFDAINPGDSRWYLELGTSGIDRVQFFWRAGDGHWVTDEAGDSRPVSQWSLPGRLPAFELASRTDKPQYIAVLRDIAARHPQVALPFMAWKTPAVHPA